MNFTTVIIDPLFEGKIVPSDESNNMWVIDSPHNRARVEALWHETQLENVHLFTGCADSRETLESVIELVDDHHPWTVMEVIGLHITEDLLSLLRRHEIVNCRVSDVGFVVWRRSS